jgi:hypothetical protein
VHEREEAMHDEQLMVRLHCLEEQNGWFDEWFEQFEERIGAQIEALTDQFATMGGSNGCHRQPNVLHAKEEDECCVESEVVSLFAECRAWRERPMGWEYNSKA